MKKRKLSKATIQAKRITRFNSHKAYEVSNLYHLATLSPEQRAFEIELQRLSQYVKTHHVHPDVKNKRVGCKYAGWIKIAVCNRKGNDHALNRIRMMQFYGDWCPTAKFDEIIPDDFVDDSVRRIFYLDFFMWDIVGNAYDIPKQTIFNPKGMTDLQNQVSALVREVSEQEGFLFDLDKCYVEIRA